MNPLQGMAIAVTRQNAEGVPPEGWLPDERITAEAALAAYTSGVAYQAFAENDAGLIAPGRRADLCLLGADPTAIPGRELADVPVLRTWLAGAAVFSDGR